MRMLICVLLTLAAAPATAVPPPPPPDQSLSAPSVICADAYGFRLDQGETALRYAPNWWVMRSDGRELGVRSGALVDKIKWKKAAVAGFTSAEKRRLFEWPGNRPRGWAYQLRDRGSEPVTISADHFDGTKRDHPLVKRVLLGRNRSVVCPAN